MTHKDKIEYYRAKGREDYPNYNPPEKQVSTFVTDMESNLSGILFIEYKNAYDDGFEAARLMLIDLVEY